MDIKKIYVRNQSTIPLGKQGENLVTQIVFPVPPELVGTTCTLLHQRALDGNPYPVSVGYTDEGVTWLINSGDTATPGRGAAQLVFTGGRGEILKSMQFSTLVLPGLEAGAEPPDPVKPWFDALMDEIASVGGATPEDIQAAVEAYLTEHPIEESDPTVPSWAKSPEKPTYTAEEVGALPVDTAVVKTVNGVEPDGHGNVEIGSPSGGYELPVAAAEKLGGVMPVSATSKMTQEVGVDKKGRLYTEPGGGGMDKKTMTAYDAGVVRPFRRYDTLYDEINPLFVTKHMNQCAANNAVEIINDGATVHEVNCALSPNYKYAYITYLENIDGTTGDTGDTSESGRTKIYFTAAYNAYGVTRFAPAMSETAIELFAKGMELADGAIMDTGGPSCPMLYSDGTTLFAVCMFAGNGCSGYVRTADISESPAPEDVVWSAAQPWTLSIDGEVGDFDMNRLNGWTDATWQTNNQIVYANSLFYQAVCVNSKAAVLAKSSDGINWEYTNTIYTDYLCKFHCEAAIFRSMDAKIWIAVRNENTTTTTSKLTCGNENYLTVFKTDAYGNKNEEYNIPDIGCKPWFIATPSSTKKGAYLLHNAQSRYSIQVEYIEQYYPGMTLGEMYGVGTNYCTGVMTNSAATDNDILMMGTTGLVTEKTGASLVYNIHLGQYLDGSKSLELIRNLVTVAADTEVTEGSENLITSGAVFDAIDALDTSGTGETWVNLTNETLEAEASGFTPYTFETASKIKKLRIYCETVGPATATSDRNMQLKLDRATFSTNNQAVIGTEGTKRYVFMDVDVCASFAVSRAGVQVQNGSTWSSAISQQCNTDVTQETMISEITFQTYQAWGLLGVGSKCIIDAVLG